MVNPIMLERERLRERVCMCVCYRGTCREMLVNVFLYRISQQVKELKARVLCDCVCVSYLLLCNILPPNLEAYKQPNQLSITISVN